MPPRALWCFLRGQRHFRLRPIGDSARIPISRQRAQSLRGSRFVPGTLVACTKYVMMDRVVVRRSHSSSCASSTSTPGGGLTSKERGDIQKAAEAEGYSESFTDLLCRFAELIGTDEVLRELARIVAGDPKI